MDSSRSKILKSLTRGFQQVQNSEIFVARVPWDSKLLDCQVPRYLKSGLGRARLEPWVSPWQCCAGHPPPTDCHGPTQGPSLAQPRPDLRYLGTWKSRSLESHGDLTTKFSEFLNCWNPYVKDFRIWTYWNPCVKDFRILDLLEAIIGFNKSFVQWAGIEVKNKKLIPI